METRERILRVAAELFSEKPYGKVSIDEVARRAGVSKGAVFHYFKSKYDLALEVMANFSREWAKHLREISKENVSPREKLRRILKEIFKMVEKKPKIVRFFLELLEESPKEGMDERWPAMVEEYLGFFEGIFKKLGIERPKVRAFLLVAVMDGLALEMAVSDGRNLDLETLEEEILKIFTTP